MIIEYRADKYGRVYVYFKEWESSAAGGYTQDHIKHYFNKNDGEKVYVPEAGVIPETCRIAMPPDIKESNFEDAVLSLANEISQNRRLPDEKLTDIYGAIYTPQQTNESKLIDIIQKLVMK